MSKYYLLLSAVLLFAFACQKTGTNPGSPISGDKKKYAVNLKISDFTQEQQHARTTDTSLLNSATELIYTALDINTTLPVSSIIKTADDSTFGEFRDSLPAGRYIVAVAAVKDTNLAKLTAGNSGLYLIAPGTDVFFAKATINVSGEVSEYMTLNRVICQLVYQFNGRVPITAAKVSVTPSVPAPTLDFYKGYLVVDPDHNKLTYTYTLPDSIPGSSGVSLSQYILNMDNKILSVRTIVSNATGQSLLDREIYSIKTYRNQTTIIRGNLFDSIPSAGGIQVKLNTPWSNDTLTADF